MKNDKGNNQELNIETNNDDVLYSVVCSCDGCSKQFEYKKVKTKIEVVMNLPQFGEYAVCDECKKKGLEFE